jgi:hypothetical protein
LLDFWQNYKAPIFYTLNGVLVYQAFSAVILIFLKKNGKCGVVGYTNIALTSGRILTESENTF